MNIKREINLAEALLFNFLSHFVIISDANFPMKIKLFRFRMLEIIIFV